MSREPIRYIIEVKHWYDRTNGNPYFSARVYDLHMHLISVHPFQYGNKSHAKEVVVKPIWRAYNTVYEEPNTTDEYISARVVKYGMCYFNHQDELKKWCKQWGEEPSWYEPTTFEEFMLGISYDKLE
tara:strand:- start:90 stop:470 length:381 start_codon:yes stop_codon:yes gene_type:complete